MPTNNRRRTIACLLRHINMTHDPNWSSVIACLGATSREKAVLALADLIEPEERTCYVEHIDDDSFHLSCGHEAAGHVSPSFCPYCGAKVVEQ